MIKSSIKLKLFFSKIALSYLLFTNHLALASQAMTLGNWIVHYSAVHAIDLPASSLAPYNIKRDGNTTVINIAPQNKQGKAFSATVTGEAKNLLGNRQKLKFQEVKQGDAIYYLASYHHRNQEQTTFSITIETQSTRQNFEFTQKLYTN